MPLKVFISHQQHDTVLAGRIAVRLRSHHQIDSHLEVIDPNFRRGEDLAAHLRRTMGTCRQFLIVLSPATRESQWVPWEVGFASEKDVPLATFVDGFTIPPEFISKWPYLRTDSDLDSYAWASKSAEVEIRTNRITFSEGNTGAESTAKFYSKLRAALNQ